MPSLEYHCQESMRLFGEPYEEVHRWLDEFAGSCYSAQLNSPAFALIN